MRKKVNCKNQFLETTVLFLFFLPFIREQMQPFRCAKLAFQSDDKYAMAWHLEWLLMHEKTARICKAAQANLESRLKRSDRVHILPDA